MKANVPKGAIKTALKFFAALLVYEHVVAPVAGKAIVKIKPAKGGTSA